MTEIKIEKNIPIPKSKTGEARVLTGFPKILSQMEIGDSIFILVEESDMKRQFSLISGKAYSAARRKGFEGRKYSARRVEGGVRLWRIA